PPRTPSATTGSCCAAPRSPSTLRQPRACGRGGPGAEDTRGETMAALRTITETRAYAKLDSRSAKLWERAQSVLPGGNSRTTVYMAPRPIYAAEGEGC